MSGALDVVVAELDGAASAYHQACAGAEAWRDDQRTQFDRSTSEPLLADLRRLTAVLRRAGAEIDQAQHLLGPT